MVRLCPRLITDKPRKSRTLSSAGVRYLFIGKSGAILLGFPDSTQAVEIFVDRDEKDGRALVAALLELGFDI